MKMFRKMKGKLGFTLAEMLIVVALLAIIMAIAAPNVAKYSKSIKQRELDDSARSIYMAFEHQLASNVEMGEDLTNKFDLGDPKPDVWGGIDKGIVKKPSKTRYTDAPDSMMGFYIHRENDSSGLFKNIVESELDHNNYIIEFNPETGDVFGVFYSEKVDFEVGTEYEYKSDSYDNDEKDVDGKPKSPFYRAVLSNTSGEYLIGYYGGDGKDSDRINDDTLPKPIVKIINKEKLVVTIKNGGSGTNPVNVSIKLGDKEIVDNKKQLTPNLTATFILDSLSTNPKPTINDGVLSETPYETNIATWLGNPTQPSVKPSCEDMTLTVTFSDPEGKMKDQTVKKTFNPLFADGSTADMAYIEYGRHLQNLDKAATVPKKAVVGKTIDFAKKPDNAPEYEYWKQVYGDQKFTSLTIEKIDISAPGVEIKNINIKGIKGPDNKLRAGLFERSADGFKAHDIIFRNPIIEGDNAWAGAVAAVLEDGGKAENITVINPQFDVTTDAGGIAGYARKCEIKNCQVYVEKTDGTDEGWSDPSDPHKDPYSKYTISANRYAGGIVGGTEGDPTIENCIAAVKVKSGNYAGGLVGKAANTTTNTTTIINKTTIKDCAVFGHTYEGAFDGEFVKPDGTEGTFDLHDNVSGKTAGGLIGSCDDASTVKLEGKVFSTCSVMGTVKVDTAYNGTAPTIDSTDPNTLVYTLGTAYKGTEKTTKSADTRVKSAADDEIAISEDEAVAHPELVPVAQRYDSKVSAKFKFKVPQSVTDGKMILRGDWPTEEESVSGFFYWEKEGEGTEVHYHVRALYYNGLDPDNENSSEPEKEVKELINNLCYEKDGNRITEYGYGAFMLDSEPDIKYQKAKYTSNMDGNDAGKKSIYKGTFGWDYAGSYGKIVYDDIQLTDILGDKITDSTVQDKNAQDKIKAVINGELKKKFQASSIDVSIIDNIKYVMYKEKSGANNGWTKAGTVKATLDDHNYYFAPDYCALAASESVPFPTDENGYSLGQVIGVNKADIAPRALALGTCSYRADTTLNDKDSYIRYLKYLEYWNPYEVRTESQLRHIQQGCDNGKPAAYAAIREVTTIENDMNVAFKQSHDIKPASALNPIGKILKPPSLGASVGEISNHKINNLAFHGTYDGQSYRIIDAQFEEDDNNAAGLFAEADHATLQNIILFHEADSVAHFLPLVATASPSTTAKFIGGIAAIVRNTTVENCVVSGYNITARNLNKKASNLNFGLVDSSIGGIVGALDYFFEDANHPYYNRVEYSLNGTTKPYNKNSIRYCHANVSFEDAQVENLGGILGVDNSSLLKLYIENCYSIVHKGEKGIDPATYRIGGIVGEIYEISICRFRGCYSIFEGMPDKPQSGDKNYDAGVVNDVIYVHRMGLAQGDRWNGNSYKPENNQNYNQNYYVNDEGFANKADVGLNNGGGPFFIGEGVSYKDLLTKLKPLASDSNYETAKAANLADKTYIKAVEPIEQGQPGAYPLMAFTVDVTDGQTTNNETTDKIPYRPIYRNDFSTTQGSNLKYENASLGKFVHYGPWPEVPGVVGDLVRGPLAGIFDVAMYNYGSGDNNSFSGHLAYNRGGILYSATANMPTGTKYAGVFFANPVYFDYLRSTDSFNSVSVQDIEEIKNETCIEYKADNKTINDPKLKVYVNGKPISNECLMLFSEYVKKDLQMTGWSQFYENGDTNNHDEFYGGAGGTNSNSQFNFYVILDKPYSEGGKAIPRDNIKEIKINYIDDGTEGTLIVGNFDQSPAKTEVPPSKVDGEPIPKVLVFMAANMKNDDNLHKDNYPYYVAPYIAVARATGLNDKTAYGEAGMLASQSYIGVALTDEDLKYFNSKDLYITVCGVRARLTPWRVDETGVRNDQGDISNLDKLFEKFGFDRSKYKLYYISNLTSIVRGNALNGGPYIFSIQFGTSRIMRYTLFDFHSKQPVTSVEKSLMPKIGIGPLYYSPGKGYIRAGYFAAYNDPIKTDVANQPWISREGYNNNDFQTAFKVSDKEFVLYLKANDGENKSKDDLQKEINNNITVKLSGVTVLDSEGNTKTEKDPKDPSKDIKVTVTEVTLNQIKDIQFYNEDWQYDNKNTLAVKFSTPENIEITDKSVITVYYKQQPDVDAGEVGKEDGKKDGEVIISQPIKAFDKGKEPKDCIPKIALAGIYKEGESNNYLQGFVYDPADKDENQKVKISEKGSLAGKTVVKTNKFVLAMDIGYNGIGTDKDIGNGILTVKVISTVKKEDGSDKTSTTLINPKNIVKMDSNPSNISEFISGSNVNAAAFEIKPKKKLEDKTTVDTLAEDDVILVEYAGVQVMEKKVSKFYTPK